MFSQKRESSSLCLVPVYTESCHFKRLMARRIWLENCRIYAWINVSGADLVSGKCPANLLPHLVLTSCRLSSDLLRPPDLCTANCQSRTGAVARKARNNVPTTGIDGDQPCRWLLRRWFAQPYRHRVKYGRGPTTAFALPHASSLVKVNNRCPSSVRRSFIVEEPRAGCCREQACLSACFWREIITRYPQPEDDGYSGSAAPT